MALSEFVGTYRTAIMQGQTHRTAWTDQEGLEHEVVTPKRDGETATEHAARHKEAVDALKALFPPVASGS